MRLLDAPMLPWLCALLLGAGACELPAKTGGQRPPAELMGATIERVLENPAVYQDKRVVVSGEVGRVLGSRALLVGGPGFLFQRDLLVVSKHPLPGVPERVEQPLLAVGDLVQVTGVVRVLEPLALEKEVGWDLPPELEDERRGQPVLVARSFEVTPRKPRAAARAGERARPGAPEADAPR